jgi:hypothetical protein
LTSHDRHGRPADLVSADPLPCADRRGKRLPETLAAIETRNLLMIEAVERFAPGASSLSQGHELHHALRRFECGAWRRDKIADACPARWSGRLEAYLWAILRARDHVPSVSAIRQIIGDAKKSSATAFRCQSGPPNSDQQQHTG